MAKSKAKSKSKKSVKRPKRPAKKSAAIKPKSSAKKLPIKKAKSAVKKSAVKKQSVKKPATKRSAQKPKSPSVKIGLFGGTFNPIHYGHLSSLETVQQELNLAQVLIMPAAQNPLRANVEGASPDQRIAMAKIAAEMLNQNGEKFIVRDDEIKRGGPSYTIETLKALKKEMPKADLYLIVGADQIEKFSAWKEYENILKLANLVVTTRPGTVFPEDKAEMVGWLRPLLKNFKSGKGTFTSGKKLFFVKLQDVDVSSTEVRRRLRNKEVITPYTPSPIADYIAQNKLYDGTGVKIGDFEAFTRFCADILDSKGALGISGYDLRSMQQPAEFTIAASGTSTRHAKALAEYIIKEVKDEFGAYPQSTEGMQEGRWIIVDYGALMIHLFYDFVRNEYRIEELWREAQRLELR